MVSSPIARTCQRRDSGQTLVEFALVFPIIMVLLMALLEFAVGFNAFIAINRASQNAGHMAAIMTNQSGADCLILSEIEEDVSAPQRPRNIVQVTIERTALGGDFVYQEQVYQRTGSMACTLPDGTDISLPYTLTANGYPNDQRCPVLKGCPTLSRSTVDNIGVKVTYRHEWITPLSVITEWLPGGNVGWTFTQRNIFRMEPSL